MATQVPAIKVLLLPKDNALGTIFGGAIPSHIDLASAVEARKVTEAEVVLVAVGPDEAPVPIRP
ncbi:MAG: hypothetical protein K2Y23_19480 [Cyanobacteria bacterium]|nr:hypothetical protein [Cyanobacteriota bacterium]